METKLHEIACIRNALAHFRPVTQEQVAILKNNGSQILKKFQADLDELVFAPSSAKLPPWEISLDVEGISEPILVHCSAYVSPSSQWVFLDLRSEAHIIRSENVANNWQIRLKVLDLEKLLRAMPNVRGKCVVAFERASAPEWDGDSSLPPITKIIRIAFPNQAPRKKASQCVTSLPEELLDQIDRERNKADLLSTHLIKADELKHGPGPTWWWVKAHQMIDRARASEFVENWNGLAGVEELDELLTSLARYPWMNIDTSDCVGRNPFFDNWFRP